MPIAQNIPFVGKVWSGDSEIFDNLIDLEETFWVLFTGSDLASKRSAHLTQHFLDIHQPKVPVVEIRILGMEDARSFQLAFLPQIRLYCRGQEVGRHRGVATVEVLTKFYQRSLK